MMSVAAVPCSWTSPPQFPMMPTSNLPNTTELSPEDDWTKVKDPKEKKRIQNRVAQRTYRHRMKARLGELQARLDSHEGCRSSSVTTNTNSASGTSSTSHSSTTPETSDSSLPPPSTAASNGGCTGFTTGTNLGGLQAPGAGHESPTTMAEGKHIPGQLPLTMLPAAHIYEQPVDDSDPALFAQPPGGETIMQSPSQSIPSPPPNGIMSPPGQQPEPEQAAKVSEDFMLDCLRFQTQLLNRLNNLQPEPPFAGGYSQAADNVHGIIDHLGQDQHVSSLTGFTPGNTDGMDFSFDGTSDAWKTESYTDKVHQLTTSADTVNYPPPMTQDPGSGHLGPTMLDAAAIPPPPPPPHAAPAANPGPSGTLDQRFESVMREVAAAGFDNFDDLVSAYYGGSFGDPSPMSNEQRLSRNRRLPKVVSDIAKAADGWSSWERRGFQEEVLRTAEGMVMAEGSDGQASLANSISPLFDGQNAGINTAPDADTIMALKRSMQNELPNSWALTLALASDSRASWQHDQSNTALATMLLSKFSGKIPNEQLLSLLGVCLT